nr:DUF1178 family protein [Roseibium hamelinense]
MQCEEGVSHRFDAWFRSSADFDEQRRKKLLTCPVCGSEKIEKSLMAPAVSTARQKALSSNPDEKKEASNSLSDARECTNVANLETPSDFGQPEKLAEFVSTLRSVKEQLLKDSRYVGSNFAEEARKMHYGEKSVSPIHGETTPDNAKALLEEGIPVVALPRLPEDKN